jgi:hypothetical protein
VSGYFDDPDERSDNSGGGLRKQLEDLLSENRELRKLVEGDRQAAKATTATDLLKSKGLDPAVLQLVPEEADPVEWVEKYSHLLGAKGTETDETKIDEPAVEAASDDDPALVAEREALAAMQDAATAGSQATVSNDVIEKMKNITDEAEFLKFIRENGGVGA